VPTAKPKAVEASSSLRRANVEGQTPIAHACAAMDHVGIVNLADPGHPFAARLVGAGQHNRRAKDLPTEPPRTDTTLPVRVLSKLFRRLMLTKLAAAHAAGDKDS
jgi:hypothetical protein